jgi:small GTP-binding protein
MDDYDFLLKVILIGDTRVGKSSIVSMFVNKRMSDLHDTTIGVDFNMKKIELDSKIAKLQLWDTAGQEKFRSIIGSYYRCAHATIVVFDLTSIKSFENIENWFKEIDEKGPPITTKFLIGNKSDLVKDRKIDKEIANEIAERNDATYFECSAKNNNFIEEMFKIISEKTLEKCIENNIDTIRKNNTVKINNNNKIFKCCSS